MARSQKSIFEQDSLGLALGRGRAAQDVDAMQQGMLLFRLTGERDFLDADIFYVTTLTTHNGSGVTGEVIIGYDTDSDTITVAISASGLEPNQVHIQHIHGFPDGTNATTPTPALDDDGDGFVELLEGQDTYGPIIVDFGNIDPNQDGTVDFRTTVKLQGDLAGALPLENRHIVVHGRSVGAVGAGTPGEVDGTPGFKVVLPVLCGEIVQQGRGQDALEFRDVPRRN